MKQKLEQEPQNPIVMETSLQEITDVQLETLRTVWPGSVDGNTSTFFLPRNTEFAIEHLENTSDGDIETAKKIITLRKLGGSIQIEDPLSKLALHADNTVVLSFVAPLSTDPQIEHEKRMTPATITIGAGEITLEFHHKMQYATNRYSNEIE